MQRFRETIPTTRNGTLIVLSQPTVTVYRTGTLTLASLFSDNGVTSKSNPFTGSTMGLVEFYAADGRYDIVVSKPGFSTVTLNDVLLEDPADGSTRSPEGYGAIGDGTTVDTAAFAAAFAASKTIECTPGKIYVAEIDVPIIGLLKLNGAIIRRPVGADHAIRCQRYRSQVEGGEVRGGDWVTTTVAAASSGATALTVASAAQLKPGMRCFYPSAWTKGGIETNEITTIVGTTVNLGRPLKGNVTNGVRFLADFPIVVTGGTQYAGHLKDLFIRDCLVGLESGNNGEPGSNAFTGIDNVVIEDYVGAGIVFSANIAGEDFGKIRVNGGKTQVATYAGTGAQVRFAIPYKLAKKVYRWGLEPSIRVFVNGTKLLTSAYTVDLATMEAVLNVAPALAATVEVQNYEYSAFNLVGQNISASQGSSIERLSNTLGIAANIGQFYEDCELGFLSNVQMDTCGYAGTVLVNSRDFNNRGLDNLYSPFGIIIDGDCDNITLSGFGTSLVPDGDEFSVTSGKTELVVETGATRIGIDWLSWTSKNGFTYSIPPGNLNVGAKVQLTPELLAIGGAPSGAAVIYEKGGTRFFQVTEDIDQIVLGGGAGYKYLTAAGSTATLSMGAPETGGRVELTTAVGVALSAEADGRVLIPSSLTVGNGAASGRAIFYGTSGRFVQIPDAGNEINLSGGSGTKYLRALGSTVTLSIEATDSGGIIELKGPTGVKLRIDNFGNFILVDAPTSAAGLATNALWIDTGAGRVVKAAP